MSIVDLCYCKKKVQPIAAFLQKQNQLQQVREAEDANVANTFGNIVQGAITAAELAALLA